MERLPSVAVCVDNIEHELRNLTHPACTLEIAGRCCEEVTSWRRALGIRRLLVDADTDGFYHELLRSAHTKRYYLKRCKDKGFADYHTVASRSEPFMDALAAGGLPCAKDLASLSLTHMRQGEEYPEDFAYTRFLLDFVLMGGKPGKVLETRLAEYGTALGDASEPRLKLCEALLHSDASLFGTAFDALLRLRAQEVAQQQQRLSLDPVVAAGENVFIEGLALLRLAEEVSIPTREEYPFCPALARLPMQQPFPEDGYPH